MSEEVTVKNAIRKGYYMIVIPTYICLIGIPAVVALLAYLNFIPLWYIGIAFIIGFLVAWLVWSFRITKWRIWAFTNVRNVHELEKKAIKSNLIWPTGHYFERTEIRTSSDKIKLKKIEEKFKLKDMVTEDPSLPNLIEIFYSKGSNRFRIILGTFVLSIAILSISFNTRKGIILGGIMLIIAINYLIKEYKIFKDNLPQLVLSNLGVKTKLSGFIKWENINKIEIINEGSGNDLESFLILEYTSNFELKFEKVKINRLDVSSDKLEELITTYKIRSAAI